MARGLLPFEGVVAEFEAQGIEIDFTVAVAGQQGRSGLRHTHEPHQTLAAVAEAGRLLRKDPERKLADGLIRPTDTISNDIGALALTRMINASIDPVIDAEVVFPSGSSCDVRAIEVCRTAEKDFAFMIEDLKKQEDVDEGGEIIVDNSGSPIMLRKASNVPSSLSLTELVVNGIPYPAGSLFNTRLGRDRYEHGDRLLTDPTKFTVVSIQDISKIGFMRLSAYSLKDIVSREPFINGMVDLTSISHILGATPAGIAACASTYVLDENRLVVR